MTPASTPDPNERVRIFLSYSSHDTELARRLWTNLESQGVKCFFAPSSIKALEGWRVRLEDEVQVCNLLLLLHTSAASDSLEVQREVEQAERANREIWEVRVEPTTVARFFRGRDFTWKQAFSLSPEAETACFEALIGRIDEMWPSRNRRLGRVEADNCPYPGAQSFPKDTFDHAFFGHVDAIHELTKAITGGTRLVLVDGPSGSGKTSLLTVGLRKALSREFAYSLPINGASVRDLLRQALDRLSGPDATAAVGDDELDREIPNAVRRGTSNRYVLCFDQMETFFTENTSEGEAFLRSVRTILAARAKPLTILVSFRKEALADVQRQVKKYFKDGEWDEVFVPKLSVTEARRCIVLPAAGQDVTFDDELAEALIEALAKDDGSTRFVNPMDIQKVCRRLWERILELPGSPYWLIDPNALIDVNALEPLRKADEGLPANAKAFAAHVLSEFLHTTIGKIVEKIQMETGGNDPKDYVMLCLALVFVGPFGERLRVGEREADGERYVGRLRIAVVKELVNSGLVQSFVQSSGERQYELAHDSLAVEIMQEAAKSKSVSTVRRLESVVDLQNTAFNQQADLLADLEAVRENKWPFDTNEADFIVRSALGDRRQTIGEKPISLDAWVRILGNRSRVRLLTALSDALDSADPAVQLDVLDLLQKQPDMLTVSSGDENPDLEQHTRRLEAQLQRLALDGRGKARDENAADVAEPVDRQLPTDDGVKVQEKACAALVALGYGKGIKALFDHVRDSRTRHDATMALALTRHAVDTLRGPGETFREHWKRLGRWRRLTVLARMCWWRTGQTYGWILYIAVLLAAPLTAFGAILPFMPLGHLGASLTIENKGVAAGIFHGATGGVVWGLTVSLGVLLYAVLWRGGRLRDDARETIAMATFGAMGASLGGVANSAVISLVFFPQGLYNAGWLADPQRSAFRERLAQVLIQTRHGWIMPLFGAALGVGIGWALTVILADAGERWRKPSPFASGAAFWAAAKTIVARVMRESWRNALCLAVGAVVVWRVIAPGEGACVPAEHAGHDVAGHAVKDGRLVPEHCVKDKAHLLPPRWVRTAGLALIIFFGSVFQEMAFLFGLLSVQFGKDLTSNLREDRYFLRSAANTAGRGA